MSLKANRRVLIVIISQIISLLLSTIILISYNGTFINLSRIGIIFIFFSFFSYCLIQKKIFSVSNLYLLLFILFQFGLPIAYAVDESFHSFYVELFSDSLLTDAVKFTVIAIQVYTLFSSLIVNGNNSEHHKIKGSGKWTKKILDNQDIVAKAALWMFVITGIISVPVNVLSAINALTSSTIISNQFRGAMSGTGIGRALQQFYFPSALVFLCFSTSRSRKKIVSLFYIVVALAMIAVADRSGGVSALIVYSLYKYNAANPKEKKKNIILLFITGIALIILSVIVARYRLTGNLGTSLSGNYFSAALEEMGFNFTSLCFVMEYIPVKTGFRYGISYLVAFALLVPKTLGLKSVYPALKSYMGETWLYNANILYGRSYLSFGVGFSLIAESYYNFGWFGILIMIPLSYLLTYFIKEDKYHDAWHTYLQLVLMLSFFTLPRRQFADALKAFEYSIFFMMLYLLIFINIYKRRNGKR